MAFESIGEIIATRQLFLIDENNTRRPVSVFVGKPHPARDSPGYCCPFQVIGIGGQETRVAQGRDSIHALQAAMILIAANLNHLNEELGGKLTWDGARGELGFP
jgi:hypothetical protein